MLPVGAQVVVTEQSGGVFGWDLSDLEPLWFWPGEAQFLDGIASEGVVALRSGEAVVHLDAETGREVERFSLPWEGRVYAHPSGTWGFVREFRRYRGAVWGDAPSGVGRLLDRVSHFGSADFVGDGSVVVVAGSGGDISAWDVGEAQALWTAQPGRNLRSQFFDHRAVRVQESDAIVLVRLESDTVLDLESGEVVEGARTPRLFQSFPAYGMELRGPSSLDGPGPVLSGEGRQYTLAPAGAFPYSPPTYRINPDAGHYAYLDGRRNLHLRRLADNSARSLPFQESPGHRVVSVTAGGDVVVREVGAEMNGARFLTGALAGGPGNAPDRASQDDLSGFEHYLEADGDVLTIADNGELRRIDRQSGTIIWTSDPVPDASFSSVSPNERSLLLVHSDRATGVDLETGELTEFGKPPTLMNVGSVVWSRSGLRAVFPSELAVMNEIWVIFAAYDFETREMYTHETEQGTFGDETGTVPRQADWVNEQTVLLYTAATNFSKEYQELWRPASGAPEPISRAQVRQLQPADEARFWVTYRATADTVERYDHRTQQTRTLEEAPAGARYPRVTELRDYIVIGYADNWFEILPKDDFDSGVEVYIWDAERWASWNDEELIYVAEGAEKYLLDLKK